MQRPSAHRHIHQTPAPPPHVADLPAKPRVDDRERATLRPPRVASDPRGAQFSTFTFRKAQAPQGAPIRGLNGLVRGRRCGTRGPGHSAAYDCHPSLLGSIIEELVCWDVPPPE